MQCAEAGPGEVNINDVTDSIRMLFSLSRRHCSLRNFPNVMRSPSHELAAKAADLLRWMCVSSRWRRHLRDLGSSGLLHAWPGSGTVRWAGHAGFIVNRSICSHKSALSVCQAMCSGCRWEWSTEIQHASGASYVR